MFRGFAIFPMKAARIHSFGDPEVILIDEIPPPQPKENQVLLKVAASSLNHIDLSIRAGEMKLLTQFKMPRTLGFDVAGEVMACGAGVTSFLPGDRVAGMTGLSSGGAAEFCCIRQSQVTRVPDAVSLLDAAAVPLAGATALQALRGFAHLRANQRVLINGAAGGVGSYAVQIAKIIGAHVTAVCRSEHFDHIRALGADHCIDYQNDSLTFAPEKYDVVFDAAAKLNVQQLNALVEHGGQFVTTRPGPNQLVESLIEFFRGAVHLHFILTKPRPGDFALLLRLIADGRLKPCIARSFPLVEAAAAHRFFETQSVAGKILLLA